LNLQQAIPSLGFLGAGNKATAILKAVVGKRLLDPQACAAMDVLPGRAESLAAELGIRACSTPGEILATCKAVVLATKPQDMKALLESIRASVKPEHLIISIAAGVPCRAIEAALPAGTRVVRVMPNTPALIGEGAAGVAGGANASDADVRAVITLFEAVGIAAEVKEEDLDAITALSGSGPAYVFKMIELLSAAGEEMGLSPELSRRFAIQTFVGAARLAATTGEDPAELRKRVTSKGGTTAAALEVMEKGGLDDLFKRAVIRAQARSRELAAQV
jgi:pyrroline-5-carboxylate reductase